MERGSMFFIIKFYVKFQMDATTFQFISLFLVNVPKWLPQSKAGTPWLHPAGKHISVRVYSGCSFRANKVNQELLWYFIMFQI